MSCTLTHIFRNPPPKAQNFLAHAIIASLAKFLSTRPFRSSSCITFVGMSASPERISAGFICTDRKISLDHKKLPATDGNSHECHEIQWSGMQLCHDSSRSSKNPAGDGPRKPRAVPQHVWPPRPSAKCLDSPRRSAMKCTSWSCFHDLHGWNKPMRHMPAGFHKIIDSRHLNASLVVFTRRHSLLTYLFNVLESL